MPEAARIGDQVSHSSAFAGLIVGALAGAVIGAAIIATGGAAALAIAGAACTGASLGGMIGEVVGSMIPADSGPIITGAATVYIGGDGRQAAIACGSKVACVAHKVSLVAQGSETVLIEGLHAARKTDKGVCGFVIAQGCSTVLIGGPVHTCADIHSEVPWQAEAALLVLGLAGGGLAMTARGLGMAAIAARLGGGFLGGIGGGMGGHWAGGKIFGEGSTGQKVLTFAGGFAGAALGSGLAGKFVPGEVEVPASQRLTPEMEQKILYSQRVPNANSPGGMSNEVIGGHSPQIKTSPNFDHEVLETYPDGTSKVKFVTQFPDGNLSKIKQSTLAPDDWTDQKILDTTGKVADTPEVASRVRDGATLHRQTVDGVQWEVIKDAQGNITSSYPTGGNPSQW